MVAKHQAILPVLCSWFPPAKAHQVMSLLTNGRGQGSTCLAFPGNTCDLSRDHVPLLQEFIFTSRCWGCHLERVDPYPWHCSCRVHSACRLWVVSPRNEPWKKDDLTPLNLFSLTGCTMWRQRQEVPSERRIWACFIYFICPRFLKITLWVASAPVPHFLRPGGREIVSGKDC